MTRRRPTTFSRAARSRFNWCRISGPPFLCKTRNRNWLGWPCIGRASGRADL
ncbi:Hypothetical protein CpCap5W_1223 [Corynebacterium pseudotuberculosis]|nr:hypothetical protein CPTA_02038 [Corynebacterium pseudotuberculosis]AIG09779.1 hypothetical protein CPTB_01723 [Corynebacterium pseudotuberculosis]AIG12323.1 hypothetical protein CPTC_02035 [Corynebacterium pseudotuberculosis]AKC74219.1 Hypothetical protein Cp226_1508 [Corynebacterium pseudotuberculosis]AQL51572.1 hypothetical protein CpPA04_1478 [Corynebacterium pseudotuberculosis]